MIRDRILPKVIFSNTAFDVNKINELRIKVCNEKNISIQNIDNVSSSLASGLNSNDERDIYGNIISAGKQGKKGKAGMR